ncbi:kinase-like protein [Thozetella sp. PMI_491]|nr:kinase-like protein [Thozetella sp. PMI_491]
MGDRYWGLDQVDAEDPEAYCEGGYCPVEISQVLEKRFKIIHKLGWGGFSTVWLARELNKNRYVALKIVTADGSTEYDARSALVLPLQKLFPDVFLAEYERFFIKSPNGRHLCQVLPVLGLTLAALSDPSHRLYPEYAKDFSRQIAEALKIMHSYNICHGDLTPRNISQGLSTQLDDLSEGQIWEIFPIETQEITLRDEEDTESISRAPKNAVQAMDLSRLPARYLSSKVYVMDFDQAYTVEEPPSDLLGIPPIFLAPESIFELRNGPPADIWALGCIIFRMRGGMDLFYDMPDTPSNVVCRMQEVLGGLPFRSWKTVFFDDNGWPVHDTEQDCSDSHTFSDDYRPFRTPLRKYIEEIRDLKRSEILGEGKEKDMGPAPFTASFPQDAFRHGLVKQEWMAENAAPISRQEVDLFYDLMCKCFKYDPEKRITAADILAHRWLRQDAQIEPLEPLEPTSRPWISALVVDKKLHPRPVRAVLDTGSKYSFLTRSVAEHLGLAMRPLATSLDTTNHNIPVVVSHYTQLDLKFRGFGEPITAIFLIINSDTLYLEKVDPQQLWALVGYSLIDRWQVASSREGRTSRQHGDTSTATSAASCRIKTNGGFVYDLTIESQASTTLSNDALQEVESRDFKNFKANVEKAWRWLDSLTRRLK